MKTLLPAMIVFCAVAFCTHRFYDAAQHSVQVESAKQGQFTQDFDWPPRLNELYPDLNLIDQEGNRTRLSQFKGQIILVEPIGLPCAACQAFCGGHQAGGFKGIQPQPGLPSMTEAARQYGRFDLSDDQIVKVYLLLYGMDMRAPVPQDAAEWADHFGLDRSRNEIVLTGLPSMMSDQSFTMIPGLQLIDRDFVLRIDSTGRSNQKHDLYRTLLPRVRELQAEQATVSR